MYTFIDVAKYQTGIDFAKAAVDGVLIKAAGANDGLYVAGGYAAHVANGRKVFGNVGHYFFNGLDASPTAAADYFVDNALYLPGDALVLDVESEGAMRQWTPDEAFEFCSQVKTRLKVVPMLYMSAGVVRNYDWSKCIAIGAKLWVASYGSNTGVPGADPEIGSQWAEWSMWQYTSQATVPGWTGVVDLNLSRIPITEVHSMPRTLQGVIDYARSHPTRDGGSWAGWCASFVYRAGAFSQAFTNAMTAGNYAGWLNPDWRSAPAGAIHYWAGVGGDGHTAFELGGGLLLMASNNVTDRWGTALGTVPFSTYAGLGIPYRGWSKRWGTETLATASTAGGGTTPIDNSTTQTKDEDMPNLFHLVKTDGNQAKILERPYSFQIVSTAEVAALKKAYPGLTEVSINEYDYNALLTTKNRDIAAFRGQIPVAEVDTVKLAAAVSGAVINSLNASGVKVDLSSVAPEIAAAVDKVLADDFAVVPGKVADEFKDRL